MLAKAKNNIFVILILVISIFLALKNYTPGTILSGWDTLHPEFNFGLNFERILSGVFREEQGLGAVAAHSHMADLPRILILYLASFFLSQNFLRYSYIFLNLIIGPVGMYFFLQKVVIKNKFGSFLGSLFYLLNLGTMQQFIVPFEMFTTQYAILPWIFLTATNYFHKATLKNVLFFSVVTFLAAPMAYAPTLWYVYFGCLALYLLSLSAFGIFKKNFYTLRRVFVLLLLTLLINSFWILPNLYFLKTEAKFVPMANINKLFSSEAFLYNKEFGDLKNISLIKTFLFDWDVYSGNKKFEYLLSPWIKHLKNPNIEKIGLLFPIMAMLGLIYAFKKKSKEAISFITLLFISLFFLINDNPPTGAIFRYLQSNLTLFNEALRFPDDKILGIFIFIFAIYIGIFEVFMENIIKKIFKKSYLRIVYLQLVIVFALLVIYMLPAFSGNLISPYMRIKIPKEYFSLFKWFNEQPNTGRIANLPIHSPWGWEYYDWYNGKNPSFQGAGFLWFGIKQPMLNRDFDRWSPYNEQYYREMSEAIYSQDFVKLKSVLKKYDINYILLDKSVIAPEQTTSQVLFFDEIERLLLESSNIQQVFHSGKLFVYQVSSQNQNVRIIKNPLSVDSGYSVSYDDFVYLKYNDYITYSDLKKNTISYSFKNSINNGNLILSNVSLPSLSIGGQQYSATLSSGLTNDCPTKIEGGKSEMKIISDASGKFLRYASTSGPLCNHYSFPTIPRDQGYLISITSRNISGLPLKLCVANYISRRCDIFSQLSSFSTFKEDIFLLPPISKDVGFDINFNDFAIKKSPSINDLKSIKITSFPYAQISQIERYNPIENSSDINFMVFPQSFDQGWKAYEIKDSNWLKVNFPFFFGKELKTHVLVNGWTNGWLLNDQSLKTNSQRLVIVFWPQYLEYLGFGVLIVTFAWLLVRLRKKSKQLPFL